MFTLEDTDAFPAERLNTVKGFTKEYFNNKEKHVKEYFMLFNLSLFCLHPVFLQSWP